MLRFSAELLVIKTVARSRIPDLPHPTVLLVEDHADSRALYAYDLRRYGFRVREAGNASQAIAALAAAVPDVVVTDLQLPDLDGVELCRSLRDTAPTKDVPIIAVTALADAATVRAAQDAGCASVLVKPCLPAAVRAEIERALGAARMVRHRGDLALERAASLSRKSAVLKSRAESIQGRLRDDTILARVRAEFQEMPGLHLSAEQGARLFGVDRSTAVRLFDQLVSEGFLRATSSGTYLRAV